MVDLRIGYPDNFQIKPFQKLCALCILYNTIPFVVLRTIQFHNKLCLRTIEIYNRSSNHFLSGKPYRICTQEIIPQVPFLFCHFLA